MSALLFLISCAAIDGDTLRCAGIGKVRLGAIDAPELAGHCRPGRACVAGDGRASHRALARLVNGRDVRCAASGQDRYGRIIARCSVNGIDLSCAQAQTGFAVERYGRLRCR